MQHIMRSEEARELIEEAFDCEKEHREQRLRNGVIASDLATGLLYAMELVKQSDEFAFEDDSIKYALIEHGLGLDAAKLIRSAACALVPAKQRLKYSGEFDLQ